MAHAHFDEHDFSFVSIGALARDHVHFRHRVATDMPSPPPQTTTSTNHSSLSLPRRLSRRYLRAPKRTPRRPVVPVKHEDAAAALVINRAIRAAAARHCIARPLRELAHIVEFARADSRPGALTLAARHVLAIEPACEVVLWAQVAAAARLHSLKQSNSVVNSAKEVIERAKAVLDARVETESRLARMERSLWDIAQELGEEEATWDTRESVLWLLEETRRRRALLGRERMRRAAAKVLARRNGLNGSFSHGRKEGTGGGAWAPLRKNADCDGTATETESEGGSFRKSARHQDAADIYATRSTPEVGGIGGAGGRPFSRRSSSRRAKPPIHRKETSQSFTGHSFRGPNYGMPEFHHTDASSSRCSDMDLQHDFYFATEHVEEISIHSGESNPSTLRDPIDSTGTSSGFGESPRSNESQSITPSRRSESQIVHSSPVSELDNGSSPANRREVEQNRVFAQIEFEERIASTDFSGLARIWRATAIRKDIKRVCTEDKNTRGGIGIVSSSSTQLSGILARQRGANLLARAIRRFVVRRELNTQPDIRRVLKVALFTEASDTIDDALVGVDAMPNALSCLRREYRDRLVQLQRTRRAAEAVRALRDAEREREEESKQRDAVAARAQEWLVWWTEYGRLRGDLRMLLATLHRVLPKGAKWRMVDHPVEADAMQVRALYRSALLQVHPDRLRNKKLTPLEQVLSHLVFVELQDAYKVFAEQEL